MSKIVEPKPKREPISFRVRRDSSIRRPAEKESDQDVEGASRPEIPEITDQDLQIENPFKPRTTKVSREPAISRPPRDSSTKNISSPKIEEHTSKSNTDNDITPCASKTERTMPTVIKRPSQNRISTRLIETERVTPRLLNRPSHERIAALRGPRGVSMGARLSQPKEDTVHPSASRNKMAARKSTDDLMVLQRNGFGFQSGNVTPQRTQPGYINRPVLDKQENEHASPSSSRGRFDVLQQCSQRVTQKDEISDRRKYLEEQDELRSGSQRRSRIDHLYEDCSQQQQRQSRRDGVAYTSTGRDRIRFNSTARSRATLAAAALASTAEMRQMTMDKIAVRNRPYSRVADKTLANTGDNRRKNRNANLLNATLSLVREMDPEYIETLCFAMHDFLTCDGKSGSDSEY